MEVAMKPAPVLTIPRTNSRVRFKNILFATDFGSASVPAEAYAIELSKMFGSHLFILHVDEGPGMAGHDHANWVGTRSLEMADLDFRKLESVFAGAGIPFTFLLEHGEVKEALGRVVYEHDIDLVIVGTHARHGLSYLLFGSIAESLGRSSTRPVITVGPKGASNVRLEQFFMPPTSATNQSSRFLMPHP
jgi:nucleotide-binding universal stress UspA family protein